jgi:uncharacterized protein (TIGR02246 family)
MMLVRILAVVGVGLCLAGCQTGAFCDKDQVAIGAASDDWFKQAGAGKMADVANHYTDDAVLLPPGGEMLTGRKAIAEHFAHYPKLEKLQSKRIEITGNADLAYAIGSFSFEMTGPNATKPLFERGKYIEIWRRQADGSWKITRDIWNSSVAP